jgi:TRAP-type C4-dicarboxylate transport system substrate-binding protein
MKLSLVILLLLNLTTLASAKKVKLAFLAPEGTNWAINLKKMAKEIKAENKGLKIKLYFGGVAGDEPDVLRKVRSGQLHGGIFTGKTQGDIFPSVRVMELPFTFKQDSDKAFKALTQLEPYFEKGFDNNGFICLGMLEIGQVYLVSTKPIRNMQEMKGVKIWTWEGDPLVHAMTETLQLIPVPLAITDVLSSLNTGIIQATYAPPMGIAAFQWHTKIKYLVNYPIAYAPASFLISKKRWNKLKPKQQQSIKKIAKKYIDLSNQQTRKDNEQTLAQFKSMGIEFIQFPESDFQSSGEIRNKVINQLKAKVLKPEAINKLDQVLKAL